MKIVVASGKGGVGKSMLASCFSVLFSKFKKTVAVDCDVDAPNLAIWLNEVKKEKKKIPVTTSARPIIDYEKCNGCGLCEEKCRFSAIKVIDKKPKLNPFLCEGCGVCEIVCPKRAIKLRSVQNGEIKIKKTKYGFFLISGNLFPGETGSGKIITELKKEADKFDAKVQILDSSPGTGCPVIASLQDSDLALLVTEPTSSAFSDLKRVLVLIKYFGVPYFVVINKWDINLKMTDRMEKWAKKRLLGKISYNKGIFKAISNLKPILETNLEAKKEITKIFNKLKAKLW